MDAMGLVDYKCSNPSAEFRIFPEMDKAIRAGHLWRDINQLGCSSGFLPKAGSFGVIFID
jgi:hypothetical protein